MGRRLDSLRKHRRDIPRGGLTSGAPTDQQLGIPLGLPVCALREQHGKRPAPARAENQPAGSGGSVSDDGPEASIQPVCTTIGQDEVVNHQVNRAAPALMPECDIAGINSVVAQDSKRVSVIGVTKESPAEQICRTRGGDRCVLHAHAKSRDALHVIGDFQEPAVRDPGRRKQAPRPARHERGQPVEGMCPEGPTHPAAGDTIPQALAYRRLRTFACRREDNVKTLEQLTQDCSFEGGVRELAPEFRIYHRVLGAGAQKDASVRMAELHRHDAMMASDPAGTAVDDHPARGCTPWSFEPFPSPLKFRTLHARDPEIDLIERSRVANLGRSQMETRCLHRFLSPH